MKTQSIIIVLALALIVALVSTSCTPNGTGFAQKPGAIGGHNQVVVVADDPVWNGEIGDTLRKYLESPYIILPQAESEIDLEHYTPENWAGKRQHIRNIILLADVNEATATRTLIKRSLGEDRYSEMMSRDSLCCSITGNDLFAQGQQVFYIFSDDRDEIFDVIKRTSSRIIDKVDVNGQKKLSGMVYIIGENEGMIRTISDSFDLLMRIPGEYKIEAENKGGTYWVRKETNKVSSNIIIHRQPYYSTTQFTEENFMHLRDSLSREHITSDVEGAYMSIDTVNFPLFVETKSFANRPSIYVRGIWNMKNDFKGGPFVSFMTISPDSKWLYYIEGFVFAPGDNKRDHMEHLEEIFRTAEFE